MVLGTGVKRVILITLTIFLMGQIVGSDYLQRPGRTRTDPSSQGIRLSAADRLLVIAPHPDDEIIAADELISRAVSFNVQVRVVIMTSGDGNEKTTKAVFNLDKPSPADYCRLGRLRHSESVKTMSMLGLPRKDLVFLTYPDGGLDCLFNTEWDYTKPHTGRTGVIRSPYLYSYDSGAVYCGANVVRNLKEIISTFKPTVVVFPSYEDSHADHWATNAFVQYALTDLRFSPREYTYLVHRKEAWPEPLAFSPTDSLLPPALKDTQAVWHKLPLSAAQERKKETAVRQYKTQLLLPNPFIECFIRRNELFATYPDIVFKGTSADARESAPRTINSHTFFDSPEDPLSSQHINSNLDNVSFACNDKRVWIKIEGAADIDGDLVYAIDIRIFKKTRHDQNYVTRYDAKYRDGRGFFKKHAWNTGRISSSSFRKTTDDRLILEMPADILKGADYVMFNAGTYSKGCSERKPLDRTGWYRIALK